MPSFVCEQERHRSSSRARSTSAFCFSTVLSLASAKSRTLAACARPVLLRNRWFGCLTCSEVVHAHLRGPTECLQDLLADDVKVCT